MTREPVVVRRGSFIGLIGAALFLVAGTGRAAAPLPRIPVNRIPNPGFERDADHDGIPDGWYHSEMRYWVGPAKDSPRWKELRAEWIKKGGVPARIPFRPPGTLEGGAYGWETPGYRSAHCISIDETTERKWGEWNTVVKGIKPNTDYVIMGWRRQSARTGRRPDAPPWLKIAVFGQILPVKGTLDRDTWVPFLVTVNSGPYRGDDCGLGLIIERAPTKIWIDELVMFEGTVQDIPRFRVGLNGALLEYPVHDTAYASPDLQCPLFFDLVWSFHDPKTVDPGLELVLDLPVGLSPTWSERGMGVRIVSARDATPLSIEGVSYRRWTFSVLSAKERKEFDSGGARGVRFWLHADRQLTEGTFEARYHARWKGGRQADQPLRIRILRFRPVKQPKFLIAGLGGVSSDLAGARAALLVRDLPRLGVNCLLLDGGLTAKEAEQFEKAGITPASWFQLGEGTLPAAAVARDIHNKPVPGKISPAYRAKDMTKDVFARPAALVRAGTTALVTDLRDGWAQVGFGPTCVTKFEVSFKKDHPDEKYVPPAQFEKEPYRYKELHAAWVEFRAAQFADLYWTLRRQLDQLRKNTKPPVRNAAMPLKLLAFVPVPSVGVDAVKLGSMVDYRKLAGALDVQIIEPDMYRADAGGTPAWVGRETEELMKLLGVGGQGGVAVTAGSTSYHAGAPVARHADVRAQVLEAVLSGARAVFLQPLGAVDGMDLQQFAEALALIVPFEDAIIDGGEPVRVVTAAQANASVRCLGRDDLMLVLVADYSETPATSVTLALKFPKDAKPTPRVLVDIESAQIVKDRVTLNDKTLTVPMAGRRARLFYLGPRGKLPIKVFE